MRNAFIGALIEAARRDPSLWLLTGDIGFSVLEGFASEFPERFLNVGVAEQNMIGVAAGLALSGKRVFTYTIGNFAFMRCLEQIRNELCYHNLPVTVVAVGGGFAYGNMGYTHHAIEDIAMLKVLPNLTVCAPGDPEEAAAATRLLSTIPGPGYLRLGRGGEARVHASSLTLQGAQALVLAQGSDVCIISSAATLDIADIACKRLADQGIRAGLISMPVLAPFDAQTVVKAASNSKCLITVEEHGKGGLASLVADCLTDNRINVALHKLYAALPPAPQAGDRAALRTRQGITAEAIIEKAGGKA